MMILTTHPTSGDSYNARIHQTIKNKVGKILFRGSSTTGPQTAASALVKKWYGQKAQLSMEKVEDTSHLDLTDIPDQSLTLGLTYWSFNP